MVDPVGPAERRPGLVAQRAAGLDRAIVLGVDRLRLFAHPKHLRHDLLLRHGSFAHMRARHAEGGEVAVHVVAVKVVLRAGIREKGQDLRVRGDDVVAFHESLLRHLPVALHDPGQMHGFVALLEPPRGEMLRQHPEVVGQRRGVRVEIDKDEAAPRTHLHLAQMRVVIRQMREIPAAGDAFHAAVEVPGPTVKRAADRLGLPGIGPKLAAPVRAGIDEAAYRAAFGADQQDRAVRDVIDGLIARRGNVFVPAGHLPDLFPHLTHLAQEIIGRGVAGGGHADGLRVIRRHVAQAGRGRVRVAVQHHLIGRARTALDGFRVGKGGWGFAVHGGLRLHPFTVSCAYG